MDANEEALKDIEFEQWERFHEEQQEDYERHAD